MNLLKDTEREISKGPILLCDAHFLMAGHNSLHSRSLRPFFASGANESANCLCSQSGRVHLKGLRDFRAQRVSPSAVAFEGLWVTRCSRPGSRNPQ